MANSKFLAMLAFLLLAILWIALTNRMGTWTINRLRKHQPFQAMAQALGFVILGLYLLGFWVLTRVFSLYLVLLIALVLLAGALLTGLVGAITGFALPEKRQKISVLGIIWGAAAHPAKGCIFGILGILALLFSIVGSLHVFWSHPIGDPNAKVVISFYLFALGGLLSLLISVFSTWPIVTSAYIDDDYRNFYVTSQFSTVLMGTIYTLLPMLLFYEETERYFVQRGWYWPPLWVFLSIPLLAYIFGALIPFFIGFYRYRLQRKLMIQWRKRWLEDFSAALKSLPALRSQDIAAETESLASAMQDLVGQNELLLFYQRLSAVDGTDTTSAEPATGNGPDLPPPPAPPVPDPAGQPTGLPTTGPLKGLLGIAPIPMQMKKQGFLDSMRELVKENKSSLVDWDIRVGHYAKLLRYAQIASLANTTDVQSALDQEIKSTGNDFKTEGAAKNALASVMMTGITSTIVFFFRQYSGEILKFIEKIVSTHN